MESPAALPSTADLVSRTAINGVLHPLRAGKILIPERARRAAYIAELPAKIVRRTGGRTGPRVGLAVCAEHAIQRHAHTAKGVRSPLSRPHRFQADQGLRARRDHQRRGTRLCRGCASPISGWPRRAARGDSRCRLPDSIRSSSESGSGGNRLFGRLHALETTIADPMERLAAIVDETSAFRETADTRQLPADGPGGHRADHIAGADGESRQCRALFGSCGRQHHSEQRARPDGSDLFRGRTPGGVTGLGPLIGGMNLFHIVASYNGTISIGATADRSALPDPGHYADCMQGSFEEMLSAADDQRNRRKELVATDHRRRGCPSGASRYRVAQVACRRIVTWAQSVTIVRSTIFQVSSPLLVLVEIASADDDIDIPIARTERVHRDRVDLALGSVAV